MIAVVVDASVTAAWCFEDEQTRYARDLLGQAQDLSFFVPAIWPLEMTNVLLVNERCGRITPAETTRAIALFKELEMQVDQPVIMQSFDATSRLARAHGLSAYDASYLELALRQGMPLLTLDNRLRTAAAALGVPLYS